MIKFDLSHPSTQSTMNAKFQTGERVALLGKSGAGKTSLLRAFAGLTTPMIGDVFFDDESGLVKARATWQRPVSMLHQHSVMFAHHTVEQTLAFSESNARGQLDLPIDNWLQRLELDELYKQNTAELSGGQQQRVALLRALVNQPSWLLLDESFSGLDNLRLQRACDVVNEYCQLTGAGLVLASHNSEPQRYLCQSAYMVDDFNGSYHEDLFSALRQDPHASIQSTIVVTVKSIEHGFLATQCAGQAVFVAIPERWQKGAARLTINSGLVSIAVGENHQTSMVNRLRATIVKIKSAMGQRVYVELDIGGEQLTASITQWSCDRLNLTVGQSVYADFKLSAVVWTGQ